MDARICSGVVKKIVVGSGLNQTPRRRAMASSFGVEAMI